MRLVTYTVKGLKLFPKPITIDLYATSQVRNELEVHRFDGIGSRIASETLLAFTGLNATGKTTMLRLFDFVVTLVSGTQLNAYWAEQLPLLNLIGDDGLSVDVVFEHNGDWYLLESHVLLPEGHINDPDKMGLPTSGLWRIDHEVLFRHVRRTIAKKELGDIALFKENAEVIREREALTDELLAALGPSKSVTALLAMKPSVLLNFDDIFTSPTDPIPTTAPEIARVFDPSIRKMELDEDGQMHLQFDGDEQEREMNTLLASLILSVGTVRGARIMQSVIRVLSQGGYLVIDEIENSLNKKLVQTLLDLFCRPLTNPHGALLVFSTHYPELLDYMPRTDDIYFTRRSKDGADCDKLSYLHSRFDLKRSDMFLSNHFGGTAPKASDLNALRDYVRKVVSSGESDE